MTDNVHSILAPRPSIIRAHLERLFRRARMEYPGGRCEIAWSDGNWKPSSGATFPLTPEGLDEATACAVKWNGLGHNVYVGANPRKPDTPPFGRCSGDDVEVAYHQFVEADSAEAGVRLRAAPLPYQWTVITGRTPHARPHAYWELDMPVYNMDAWRDQQKALALYFGGDATIDKARIMRLGGSVNYPTPKKQSERGYIIELTTLRTLYDEEEREPVSSEALYRFYPWDSHGRAGYNPETGEVYGDDPVSGSVPGPTPKPGPLTAGPNLRDPNRIDPQACVRGIIAGTNLHLNTRDLINHLVATGHRDWLIQDYLTRLLTPVSDGGTIAQIPNIIRTWRAKVKIPDPEEEDYAAGATATSPLALRAVGVLNPASRQPRQWISRYRMMRGHVTMTTAAAGVGKTTLTVEEGVSLASGIDFLGFGITAQYRVAIINNEETQDELERRIEATCVHFKVPLEAIADTLFVYSGVDAAKIIVARADRYGNVLPTVHTEQLRLLITELRLDVVILDPFVQIHYVEESSNEQISRTLVQIRSLGTGDYPAALHVVHHNRKAPIGNSHQAGDMSSARGASAMSGEAHFFFTLTDMGVEDGEKLNVVEEDRHKYLRLDDAKRKMAPAQSTKWLERYGVMMPYGLVGEELGILVPRELNAIKQSVSGYTATAVLTEIDRAWDSGNPYSESPVAKDRYVIAMIMHLFEMTRQAAKDMLLAWLMNGMVKTETRDTHKNLRGLRVLKWPT